MFTTMRIRPSRRDWQRALAFATAAAGAPPAPLDGNPAPPSVRAEAPMLDVTTVDGRRIEVHRQRGKVVLLDFMTTTCPSCKQAAAGIQSVYSEVGFKGFLPVAIARDSQAPGKLMSFRDQLSLTFLVGRWAWKRLCDIWNIPLTSDSWFQQWSYWTKADGLR